MGASTRSSVVAGVKAFVCVAVTVAVNFYGTLASVVVDLWSRIPLRDKSAAILCLTLVERASKCDTMLKARRVHSPILVAHYLLWRHPSSFVSLHSPDAFVHNSSYWLPPQFKWRWWVVSACG